MIKRFAIFLFNAAAVLLFTLAAIQTVPAAKKTETRPNFIFFLTDDQGWQDLACYGHPYLKTPNLDRLAGEGTRFEQFYSSATVCSPSRAAYMTGHYPARRGFVSAVPTARPLPSFIWTASSRRRPCLCRSSCSAT